MLRKLLAINRYPEFIAHLYWRSVTPYFLRKAGVTVCEKVQFLGQPIVSLSPNSRISVGRFSSLCSVSRFTALGVNHPVVLRTLRPNAVIEIGEDTGISGASVCAAIAVRIGSQCLIGANVVISDSDFHSINPKNRRHNDQQGDIGASPVHIGNNVFLGTGVIVLKGVHIGENSVIGAGSVVTKTIPMNSIAAGNPARVIGVVTDTNKPSLTA